MDTQEKKSKSGSGRIPKEKPHRIDVEVQSRHYRPVTSEWLAAGTVIVDGKPIHWNAARDYAKWNIHPAVDQSEKLDPAISQKAAELVLEALQDNKKSLTFSTSSAEREEGPEPTVMLAHGGGGSLMHELIRDRILSRLKNAPLSKLEDSASLPPVKGALAITTDSFVVNPLFFRGGDIGSLAVCASINNLAAVCAEPLALTLSFIIEEGLPLSKLDAVLESVRKTAREVGVQIVAGDTKVVEEESADNLFINTTALGALFSGASVGLSNAKEGDVVIINGPVGSHGIAVLSQREGIEFERPIESDVAPLWSLVEKILKKTTKIHCLKDPSRGGVAAALNQVAVRSKVAIEIDEASVPVDDAVFGACEMLGFDPLCVPNAGKMLIVCPESALEDIFSVLRRDKCGKQAAVIGRVVSGEPGHVLLKTRAGTSRIVDMPL